MENPGARQQRSIERSFCSFFTHIDLTSSLFALHTICTNNRKCWSTTVHVTLFILKLKSRILRNSRHLKVDFLKALPENIYEQILFFGRYIEVFEMKELLWDPIWIIIPTITITFTLFSVKIKIWEWYFVVGKKSKYAIWSKTRNLGPRRSHSRGDTPDTLIK